MKSGSDVNRNHAELFAGQSSTTVRRHYWITWVIVAFLLLMSIVDVAYWRFTRRPCRVGLVVDVPREVRVGETFPMSIVVRNRSDSETVVWTGVHVDTSYAGGELRGALSVKSSDPPWRGEDYYPGVDTYSYDDITIAPMSEKRIVFSLQTRSRSGTFAGRISVLIQGRYLPGNYPIARSDLRTVAQYR